MPQKTARLPNLRVPRAEARDKFVTRVDLGKSLLAHYTKYNIDCTRMEHNRTAYLFKRMCSDFIVWNTSNTDLLCELFTTSYYADDYNDVLDDRLKHTQRIYCDTVTAMRQALQECKNILYTDVIRFLSSINPLHAHSFDALTSVETMRVVMNGMRDTHNYRVREGIDLKSRSYIGDDEQIDHDEATHLFETMSADFSSWHQENTDYLSRFRPPAEELSPVLYVVDPSLHLIKRSPQQSHPDKYSEIVDDRLERAKTCLSGAITRNIRDMETLMPKSAHILFDDLIEFMSSLASRLDLVGITEISTEKSSMSGKPPSLKSSTASKAEPVRKVFIVHGHDEETKAVVARFLEHCKLVPVILHEQADRGRAIVEKFEEHAEVQFAVVLLTPDDVGGLNAKAETAQLRPRARQNVILELGYFIAKLGRHKVCILKKGDLELPSDYSGIIYTPIGPDEGWKLKLARELNAAGLKIDLNKVLGA